MVKLGTMLAGKTELGVRLGSSEIVNRYRDLIRMFERVELSSRITTSKGKQKVKAFQFFTCYNLKFFQKEGVPWWEANRAPNQWPRRKEPQSADE